VLTYLKATPGDAERLARFIERNWFVMDAHARRIGALEGAVLVRGSARDTTWDLLEIARYRDAAQLARVDSVFRTIIRPAHRVEPVDGRGFRELGRIVRTDTVTVLAAVP
jgi:hypothetical protein